MNETAVLHAEVAVVGAGPAGIAAAVCAAESGKTAVLLDESPGAGGNIWRHRTDQKLPAGAQTWLNRLARSGCEVWPSTSVFDIQPGFEVLAQSREKLLRIRADKVILATGARELFLPFPGWTLPGVLGVGGAQALLKSGASFAGRRVVIAGSGPLLLPVAASMTKAGAHVLRVAEQAPAKSVRKFALGLIADPLRLWQAARYRRSFSGTRYVFGTWVTSAAGSNSVETVSLTNGKREWNEKCDVLCTGYGLLPSTELARLLGCALDGETVAVNQLQQTSVPGVFCAGEPTGIGGVELSLIEGQVSGLAVSGREREAKKLFRQRRRARRFARKMEGAFALRPELRSLPRPETLICRCEDVSLSRLDPAWKIRQAKLYTRAGMGPCQGRVCGPALRFLFGWKFDTVRPPVIPVSMESLRVATGEDDDD